MVEEALEECIEPTWSERQLTVPGVSEDNRGAF
jgi:hypothetical protein